MRGEIKAALSVELTELGTRGPEVGVWPRGGVIEHSSGLRRYVSFASWNLLGLYERAELIGAARRALDETSLASGAASAVGGHTIHHSRLESSAARFFRSERALIFSSRQQAVLSIITTFGCEGCAVIGLSGASLPLADAAVVAGVDYFEAMQGELRPVLEQVASRSRVLVFVEPVSQMTGELRDVLRDAALCEEVGAWLVIDDSAGLGTSGMRGAASSEVVPYHPALLCRMAGLGLSVGVDLALVVGPREPCALVERRSWYRQVDPPVSPVLCASAEVALELTELALHQRDRLLLRSKGLRDEIAFQGWSVQGGDSVPFFGLRLDTLRQAKALQSALLQRGIVVEALPLRGFRRSDATVRILPSVLHSEAHIAELLVALSEARRRSSEVR